MTTALAILIAVFYICALAALIGGSIIKHMLLLWCSAAFWLVAAVIVYLQSAAMWDWQYSLGFISFIMAGMVALYAGSEWGKRRRANRAIPYNEDDDIFDEEDEEFDQIRRNNARVNARLGNVKRKKETIGQNFRRFRRSLEKDAR